MANISKQPADFCNYPCPNPVLDAALSGTMPPPPPPIRTTWDPLPGFPVDFQPPTSSNIKREPGTGNTLPRFSTEPQVTYAQMPKRDSTNGNMTGLPNRNLLYPSYEMAHSPQGQILGAGIWPDMPHYGGYMEYDTHNLFASGMIAHSRQGLLNRRPNERPFIITRSTFAGDGNKTGHWTGDNDSTWAHYLVSIVQHIEFASIFQIPMIGTDVCGFNLNTTETLCARWAMLGAWYPFYRNHADTKAAPQEFYLWPIVTEAAKKAISTRFSLLDYLYTGFYEQTVDGSPNTVSPMFFHYPEDVNTLNISYQFFFGPSILVSPVTIEGAQNATFYLPNDTFYDFWTAEQINGTGQNIFYDNVTYTDIPVHIRGGSIIPLRQNANSVNTTAQLREQDFQLVVALDSEGKAQGNLYLDDGHSINSISSYMHFNYDNGHLTLNGTFGYQTNLSVTTLSIYGASSSNVPTYLLNKSLSAGWAVSIDGLNATTA
jgi:alpha-glucosidase